MPMKTAERRKLAATSPKCKALSGDARCQFRKEQSPAEVEDHAVLSRPGFLEPLGGSGLLALLSPFRAVLSPKPLNPRSSSLFDVQYLSAAEPILQLTLGLVAVNGAVNTSKRSSDIATGVYHHATIKLWLL